MAVAPRKCVVQDAQSSLTDDPGHITYLDSTFLVRVEHGTRLDGGRDIHSKTVHGEYEDAELVLMILRTKVYDFDPLAVNTLFVEGSPAMDATEIGYVYFIYNPAVDEIKIGYSVEPKGRKKALQTANGSRLEILAVFRGTQKDEKACHHKFRHLRIRPDGEWFRPAPELYEFIAQCSELKDDKLIRWGDDNQLTFDF